jgi:GT2 family glycosyltransferase/glycosyltransferase involved in cell wall biosynthesis
MRVLHISHVANIGGIERVQASYIGGLAERGVASEYFCYFPGPGLDAFHSRCPVHTAGVVSLDSLLKEQRFDVLHLTAACAAYGAMEQIARARYRGAVVVSCHGEFGAGVSRRNTSVLTTPSRWLADDIRPYTDLAPLVLYNGINLSVFHPNGDEPVPHVPVVAWVGRANDAVKGFDRFLRIVAEPSFAGWEVWIADGDGAADAGAVEASTGRPVRVWHRSSVEAMAAFYRQVGSSGGVLLSTSSYDAAPLTLLEGLACGCLVVAPIVGGIPEMLGEGRWGVLYDGDAAPGEVAALVTHLAESNRRQSCLGLAEAEMPRTFSLEDMLRRLLGAYSNAIDRPVAPAEGDLDRRSFRRWHLRSGRKRCELSRPPRGRLSFLGVPGWLAKEIVVLAARAACARLRGQHEAWLKSARLLWYYVGQALEAVPPRKGSRAPSSACGRRDSVTVVVCTRNRPALLRRLLESLAACSPLPDEVLVVDQSTSGETEEVVRCSAPLFPRTAYLRMGVKGKSRALNLALREATGGILLLTDDDCVVSADWVGQVRAAFRTDPDLDCVMGRVLPPEGDRTGFRIALRTSVVPKLYDSARKVDPAEVGWGNNVAFRSAALRALGSYDESLGPGALWHNGEDGDMVYRLLRSGRRAAYAPEVVVSHKAAERSPMKTRIEYRTGRAVFLVKYLLRGDWWLFRRLRWEVANALRAVLTPRDRPGYREARVHGLWSCAVIVLCVLLRPVYEIWLATGLATRPPQIVLRWETNGRGPRMAERMAAAD